MTQNLKLMTNKKVPHDAVLPRLLQNPLAKGGTSSVPSGNPPKRPHTSTLLKLPDEFNIGFA